MHPIDTDDPNECPAIFLRLCREGYGQCCGEKKQKEHPEEGVLEDAGKEEWGHDDCGNGGEDVESHGCHPASGNPCSHAIAKIGLGLQRHVDRPVHGEEAEAEESDKDRVGIQQSEKGSGPHCVRVDRDTAQNVAECDAE